MFGNQISALETIVDIGAWEPVADNVSCFLIEMGWKAILIEPQLEHSQKSTNHYKNDYGIIIIHAAVSHEQGTASLFVLGVNTGWDLFKKITLRKCRRKIESKLLQC